MKVVGYGRCSTAEQASNGVSIEVQLRAVERIAETNGWDLTWLADEGVSGAVRPESRKRFKAALALLEAGESEAMIFTKVDRASRCTEDFARLIRLSEEQGWRLIVTEMGIDTRTPMGKAMAHMAVVFAELERDFIRTRIGWLAQTCRADRQHRKSRWKRVADRLANPRNSCIYRGIEPTREEVQSAIEEAHTLLETYSRLPKLT